MIVRCLDAETAATLTRHTQLVCTLATAQTLKVAASNDVVPAGCAMSTVSAKCEVHMMLKVCEAGCSVVRVTCCEADCSVVTGLLVVGAGCRIVIGFQYLIMMISLPPALMMMYSRQQGLMMFSRPQGLMMYSRSQDLMMMCFHLQGLMMICVFTHKV